MQPVIRFLAIVLLTIITCTLGACAEPAAPSEPPREDKDFIGDWQVDLAKSRPIGGENFIKYYEAKKAKDPKSVKPLSNDELRRIGGSTAEKLSARDHRIQLFADGTYTYRDGKVAADGKLRRPGVTTWSRTGNVVTVKPSPDSKVQQNTTITREGRWLKVVSPSKDFDFVCYFEPAPPGPAETDVMGAWILDEVATEKEVRAELAKPINTPGPDGKIPPAMKPEEITDATRMFIDSLKKIEMRLFLMPDSTFHMGPTPAAKAAGSTVTPDTGTWSRQGRAIRLVNSKPRFGSGTLDAEWDAGKLRCFLKQGPMTLAVVFKPDPAQPAGPPKDEPPVKKPAPDDPDDLDDLDLP